MVYHHIEYLSKGSFCSIIANSTDKELTLHTIKFGSGLLKYPFENLPLLYHKTLKIKATNLKNHL